MLQPSRKNIEEPHMLLRYAEAGLGRDNHQISSVVPELC